jgi:hypothetical protein
MHPRAGAKLPQEDGKKGRGKKGTENLFVASDSGDKAHHDKIVSLVERMLNVHKQMSADSVNPPTVATKQTVLYLPTRARRRGHE